MVPFEPATPPDLAGTVIFIGAGRRDPIAPPAEVERLAELFRRSGAAVSLHWEPGGHELSESEVRRRGNGLPQPRSHPLLPRHDEPRASREDAGKLVASAGHLRIGSAATSLDTGEMP